jgi:hypothetical protein
MTKLDYLEIQLRIKTAEYLGSGKRNGAYTDVSVVCYREGLSEAIELLKVMIKEETK